jgi:hypothetical protein
VSKIVFEPFVLASLRRKTLARLWRLLTSTKMVSENERSEKEIKDLREENDNPRKNWIIQSIS